MFRHNLLWVIWLLISKELHVKRTTRRARDQRPLSSQLNVLTITNVLIGQTVGDGSFESNHRRKKKKCFNPIFSIFLLAFNAGHMLYSYTSICDLNGKWVDRKHNRVKFLLATEEEQHAMEQWKIVTAMVAVFAFSLEIRPLDSYLTAFLTSPNVNATLEEVRDYDLQCKNRLCSNFTFADVMRHYLQMCNGGYNIWAVTCFAFFLRGGR